LTDKNIFDIYGGLDTRESYGNESSILSYTKAKNIDIDGKVVRRARGQTQVSIAPSGSTGAGIAPAPGGFIGGINKDGKYYRTDPVTLISTPVYTWDHSQERYLYCSGYNNGVVYKISLSTFTVVDTLSVGSNAYCLWGDSQYLYCSNNSNGVVSKISLSTFTVVDTVDIGSNAYYFWSDSQYLYCSGYMNGRVSKISLSTFTVVDTLSIGAHAYCLWGDSQYLYCSSNNIDGRVSKISLSTFTIVDAVDTGFGAYYLWGDSE